jgi:hypothetical protein
VNQGSIFTLPAGKSAPKSSVPKFSLSLRSLKSAQLGFVLVA